MLSDGNVLVCAHVRLFVIRFLTNHPKYSKSIHISLQIFITYFMTYFDIFFPHINTQYSQYVTFHDVFITHMFLLLFCVLRFYIIFVTFFVTFFVIHIFSSQKLSTPQHPIFSKCDIFVTFCDVFVTCTCFCNHSVFSDFTLFLSRFSSHFAFHTFLCLKNFPHLNTQHSQNIIFCDMFMTFCDVFVTCTYFCDLSVFSDFTQFSSHFV